MYWCSKIPDFDRGFTKTKSEQGNLDRTRDFAAASLVISVALQVTYHKEAEERRHREVKKPYRAGNTVTRDMYVFMIYDIKFVTCSSHDMVRYHVTAEWLNSRVFSTAFQG